MRLFGSANLTGGGYNDIIPKGNYKGIVFHFSGTAAVANTVLGSDLGRVRLVRGGVDICNVDLQDLLNVNNAESGVPNSASIAGGAFDFWLIYNFVYKDDLEAIARFDKGDNGLIQINYNSTLAAKIAAGTLNVYGIQAKGVEKYLLYTRDFSQTLGVTGTVTSPKLQEKNINFMYFRTAADIQNLIVSKDNYVLYNATGAALLGLTQYDNKIEAVATFLYFDLNKTKSPAELISEQIQFTITSGMAGGGNTTLLYQQVLFSPEKTAKSMASYNEFQTIKTEKEPAVKQVAQLLNVTRYQTQGQPSGGGRAPSEIVKKSLPFSFND